MTLAIWHPSRAPTRVAAESWAEGVKAKAQELLAQAEASREHGGDLAYEDSNA
ncbi:hypothetical protein OG407_05645 [Streptomyces sp. NBC_01515]|uniref:hypothetical protein n=1 Tax=Streptomyces sp. NBC_01515 TaxID=2903890 RepID=UPI00386B8E7C